jgi:hypothetical protein
MWTNRNHAPLTLRQIQYCQTAWAIIATGSVAVPLDVSRASIPFTTTGYDEARRTVFLGANCYPSARSGVSANARLSILACLTHEYAHAERHAAGYQRPKVLPDVLLDEAEASIHASFHPVLGCKDREDLVEDARDRLITWLAYRR